MREPNALRQRAIHRLVAETCLEGRDPQIWTAQLMEGVAKLFAAKMVTLVWTKPCAVPGEMVRLEVALFHGFSDRERNVWLGGFWRPRNVMDCELVQRVVSRTAPFVTVRRQDLFDDATWYESRDVTAVHRPCGVDANLASFFVLDRARRRFGIGVHRAWEQSQFDVLQRRELRRLHVELARAWRRNFMLPDGRRTSFSPLPARLRQVLQLLCQGKPEKEIAGELSLSPHTVHNHVRRLHETVQVDSRAELLALAYQQHGMLSLVMPPARMNQFMRAPA